MARALRVFAAVAAAAGLAAAATAASGTAAPASLARASDVSVVESISPGVVSPGASGTITVNVSNTGSDQAQFYADLDLGPGDWSLGMASQLSGPAFACSTSQYDMQCSIGTFAAGASASFSVPVSVGASATPGQILNSRAYVFLGMSGGAALASDARSLVVGAPLPPPPPPPPPPTSTLSLTLGGTGAGSVTSSPAGIDCGSACTRAFDSGASVTLAAVAATGSRFAGWDGACKATGTTPTCTVAMTADLQVTAAFDNVPPPPPPPPSPPSGSKPLHPVTQRTGCTVRGPLPDRDCTPGAIFVSVTKTQVCAAGYPSVGGVPDTLTREVFASYGIRSHRPGEYELDHLVPFELGGSNDQANLWPELATPRPGFHQKDRLEKTLHKQVCSGAISLAQAQKQIARNWLAAHGTATR